MVRALRRSRLTSFVAVLALLATLPVTFSAWHDASDDALCYPAAVVHDHTAHRIAAVEDDAAAPDHCVLCHWFQSLRGATVVHRFILPAADASMVAQVAVVGLSGAVAAGPSGRAPPTS